MEKNIGCMVKIASNQLSREFDKFAKPYDLTGTQAKFQVQISQPVKTL